MPRLTEFHGDTTNWRQSSSAGTCHCPSDDLEATERDRAAARSGTRDFMSSEST